MASADLVLSVSQLTSREVRAAFGREAPVISNGVDLQRFAVRSAADEQRLRERLGAGSGRRRDSERGRRRSAEK